MAALSCVLMLQIASDMDWAGVEQLGQFTFFPLIAPATKKTQIGLGAVRAGIKAELPSVFRE